MAIGTGLVRGTSRGLAREQEWKFRDHARSMASKESQLDQLIGQINTNQQMKYREERDTTADDQWAKTHELRVNVDTRAEAAETRARDWDTKRKERYPIETKQADDRHGWLSNQEDRTKKTFEQQTEANKYNIGRRTFREKVEKDTHDWNAAQEARSVDTHTQRKEVYDYSKAQRTKQESVTDMSIEEMKLRLEELKRQNTPAAIKEASELRNLLETKTQSEIDVNNARAWALKNPTRTPRTVRMPTVEDARRKGKYSRLVQTLVSKDGKKLPYEADIGNSQVKMVSAEGLLKGADFRDTIPISASREEVNQLFNGVWQGYLEQIIVNPKTEDRETLGTVLLDDVDIDEHSQRMRDLKTHFMNNMWKGFREGPSDLAKRAKEAGERSPNKDSFEKMLGFPYDHKEGGPANQGFFGAAMGLGQPGGGDMHLSHMLFGGKTSAQHGTEEFEAQEFGKQLDPERYRNPRKFRDYFFDTRSPAEERFTPFMLDEWIDNQVSQYVNKGSMDWDNFADLPDYKKAHLYNRLPKEKQPDFAIHWRSFIDNNQKDRILYRQDPGK